MSKELEYEQQVFCGNCRHASELHTGTGCRVSECACRKPDWALLMDAVRAARMDAAQLRAQLAEAEQAGRALATIAREYWDIHHTFGCDSQDREWSSWEVIAAGKCVGYGDTLPEALAAATRSAP